MLGEEKSLLILQEIEKCSLISPDCIQVTNRMSKCKEVTALSPTGAGDGVSEGLHSTDCRIPLRLLLAMVSFYS